MSSKNKTKCVFEKQVVLFLVSTRTVKTICNLISAVKALFMVKNVLLCYKGNGQCLACAIQFGMHLDS